jgi:hypothetical protein
MRFLLACIFGSCLAMQPAPGAAQIAVDVEVVLAADASSSMDATERRQQTDGYAKAFRDRELVRSLLSGPLHLIAVTYVEWNDEAFVMVPWTLIGSPQDAERFADAIARVPAYCGMGGTNITGALARSSGLLASNRYRGSRLLIDISGDGPNNSAIAPDRVRDEIIARGITINGLVLDLPDESPVTAVALTNSATPVSLEDYYARHVVGGDGAIVVTAHGMDDFDRALRFKLVREIASR